MFSRAGDIKCKIIAVKIAEPKFAQPPAFDVCVKVEEEATGESDWWHGEMSGNYGKGNYASETQMKITTNKLRLLGWTGKDLTKIGDELIGLATTAHVVLSKDGKYFNLQYIGGGAADPEEIDAGTLQARIKAIMGGAAAPVAADAAPAPARPAAPVAPPAASPFDEAVPGDAADEDFNPFG